MTPEMLTTLTEQVAELLFRLIVIIIRNSREQPITRLKSVLIL